MFMIFELALAAFSPANLRVLPARIKYISEDKTNIAKITNDCAGYKYIKKETIRNIAIPSENSFKEA